MMGTTILYVSGDNGVAGVANTCIESSRMSWTPELPFCFVLTFLYEVSDIALFTPQFPVGAHLSFLTQITLFCLRLLVHT